MYRNVLRTLFLQKLVIVGLILVVLVVIVKIWKYEGRGASEWHNEYKMAIFENQRLARCMREYDMEPFYKRQDGVVRFCKI